MKYIFFICDLDPEHMVKLKEFEKNYKDYTFYFASSKSIPNVAKQNGEVILDKHGSIGLDLVRIQDYTKFEANRDRLLEIHINSYKIETDYDSQLLKMKNKVAEDNLTPLEYAKRAFEYIILYHCIERMTKNLTTGKNRDKIIEKVSDEYANESHSITNEFDILNSVLAEKFTKEQINKMELIDASYNGKKTNPNELLGILTTHVLPQYLTQIDIRTTKDDTYTIETNLCTIIREPETMEFKIINKGRREK